jgi:serine phosphatase RsbU (regulator of sigma subunit)
MELNLLPSHASVENRDFVFYQSLTDGSSAFQLYYKTSDNNGRTWTEARCFTSFNDPIQPHVSPNSFDNQRPHLTKYENNLLLVWERRNLTQQQPQIYSAIINAGGNIIGAVERVNNEDAYCNNPIGIVYDHIPMVVWFDNHTGNNRIVLAQKTITGWENHRLSGVSMNSSFAMPVIDLDGAYIFWQSPAGDAEHIYILEPKHPVNGPRITAQNFNPSVPGRSEKVRVSWNMPDDISDITGFSWVWSRDENAGPEKKVLINNTSGDKNFNLELYADSDGRWYFSVIAQDITGNWSNPAKISYYRKTAPPPAVKINDPVLDENGFIISNNFNMSWQSSEDPFIAGYTWNLRYLDSNERPIINTLSSNIMGISNTARYENRDNGLWAFSVAAIDMAGNIGQPSYITFRANKFISYTSITYVNARQDDRGLLSINVIGSGFNTGGRITSVVLAQEGHPDIYSEFNILSDREIGGISFEYPKEGRYRLRLGHSSRGWYTSNQFLSVAGTGAGRFNGYSWNWNPSWIVPSGKITFDPATLIAAILIIFCILGSFAAIWGIGGIITEGSAIRQETLAIITGDYMPTEKKQKTLRIQKRGSSLRIKLASFTIVLVLLIVVGISTPMYILMTTMQRETLLLSLWDRSKVLLEGLASSAKAYLPMGDQGALELGFLPSQSTALPEANYVTITGFRSGSIYSDYVWATNDPDIHTKIDTAEYRPGVSRITDNLTPRYEQISTVLNNRAREQAGNLSRSIQELTQESIALAPRSDTASRRRLSDIQVTILSLEVKLTEILTEISEDIGSQPYFSPGNIRRDTDRIFIFFKPIMYRHDTGDIYFRGLIRLEVTLDSIMEAIFRGQIVLLRTILIVALAALLIGIVGAFILSTLIISPIKKLVTHIEIIRDTEDKAKLAGVEINIKSKDEIAILGSTINDMTHGLVKAALAASDLSIGKEIQKKFIPLDLDSQGNKQTSGFKDTPDLNFFGYYEGAKGVSGDYFDYIDLDDRYYAIIKCDVAGKGIPAALIMIQVATLFLNHFKQWKPDEKGMQIEEVVYHINEFIETLGFKGRFAAFTLCILDSKTGDVRFCNAGDNIVHLYSASEGRVKKITLPETPATGVIPNSMIESKGGYKVQTVTIDHGDILLLYTDGIEEAKRKFRGSDFKEIICTEGQIDTPHENHLCGQADEEMGPERVESIINAVMAREIYTMKKFHNPEGDMELQFDFSKCEGKVEEVIMAMVSSEKMFRCYKNPEAGEEARLLVDKKVDEFLKNHFLQYKQYCKHTREYPENDAYMYYTHIKEDEQYDDLTILGIKRK